MRKLTCSLILIFLIAGCARSEKGVHIQNDTNVDIQKAEELFETDERLTNVVAIFHEKEIISGVTVKTFSRFHKKKIEEELTRKIEELYEDFDVTVSADGKFIYETNKIVNSADQDKLAYKIKKLKSLSEEET